MEQNRMERTEPSGTNEKNILLLAHKEVLTFHWGREIVRAFYRYGRKTRSGICLAYTPEEVLKQRESRFVIVIGVDRFWLNDVLDQLRRHGLGAILLLGAADGRTAPVSRVTADQDDMIRESLNMLQKRGRTRTALFGIQKNDTSDERKAETFSRFSSPDDTYFVTDGDAEDCFLRMAGRLEHYDSIICSNDIMAVYLLAQLRRRGVKVPGDLFLMGNGNLHLGIHSSPSVTTLSSNVDACVAAAGKAYAMLNSLKEITRMEVCLNTEIIERESTARPFHFKGALREHGVGLRLFTEREEQNRCCPEIRRLKCLDHVLSSCSDVDLTILQRLTEGLAYEKIADETALSPDSVKYHIKRLYHQLELHSKKELKALADEYQIRFL